MHAGSSPQRPGTGRRHHRALPVVTVPLQAPIDNDGHLIRTPAKARPNSCRGRVVVAIAPDPDPAPTRSPRRHGALSPSPPRIPRADRTFEESAHLPLVEVWPANTPDKVKPRLLEELEKWALAMDSERTQTNKVRCVMEMLRMLSRGMYTYRGVFDALEVEVGRMASVLEGGQEEVDALRAELSTIAVKNDEAARAREQEHSFVIDSLNEKIDELTIENTRRGGEIRRLQQQLFDVETTTKMFSPVETEASRKSSSGAPEALMTQFAQRNRELQDRTDKLERENMKVRGQLDEALHTATKYSQDRCIIEEKLSTMSQLHDRTLNRLHDELKESKVRCRAVAVSLHASRSLHKTATEGLANAKKEIDRLHAFHEAEMRTLTPRPEFRASDNVYFKGMTSTANRVEMLLKHIDNNSKRSVDLEAENETLRKSMLISRDADDAAKPLANRVNVPEFSAFPFTDRLPPFLITKLTTVKHRMYALRDAVQTARELFEMYTLMQSRTTRKVELHMAVYVHYSDAHAAHKEVVAELGYSLLQMTYTWSSSPIVRLFGSILREEVGMWLWEAQNDFVSHMMLALNHIGTDNPGEFTAKIASVMYQYDFATQYVLAVQHQFSAIYGTDDWMSVEYDEQKHSPTNTMGASELPFMSVLRRVQLERQLTFYQQYDKALLEAFGVTGANSNQGLDTIQFNQVKVTTALMQCLVEKNRAEAFIADVILQCTNHVRSERQYEKQRSQADPYAPEATSAMQSAFMAGHTRHFYGAGEVYPKPMLDTSHLSAAELRHLESKENKEKEKQKDMAKAASFGSRGAAGATGAAKGKEALQRATTLSSISATMQKGGRSPRGKLASPLAPDRGATGRQPSNVSFTEDESAEGDGSPTPVKVAFTVAVFCRMFRKVPFTPPKVQ